MNILVLIPTLDGVQLFKDALSQVITSNTYRVVWCGIGKVESAITTTMELSSQKYDAVVLSGFCGSDSTGSMVSNVALPGKAICHDFINSDFNEDADVEFDTLFSDGSIILTGDRFVNLNDVKTLRSKYPDEVLYFDMESSAVAQACLAFGMQPLIAKLIADYPSNGDTLETYRKFVSDSADFTAVVVFIENFFSKE